MDDIEKYLATATLLPFEDVIGLVLKEHKLLTTVELFPTFGIINRNMPYGDMKLREGYSIESDDLIETSAASLVITANNLVAYPVESTRVCAHIVYGVKIISKAPDGYHTALVHWENFIRQELQNSKRATKKKWVKAIREFTITMWYDQDIQDDVLGLSQEQFFEYLHNLEC